MHYFVSGRSLMTASSLRLVSVHISYFSPAIRKRCRFLLRNVGHF